MNVRVSNFDACEPTDDASPFTEDALALRFSERHKDDLRYIATKGTWLKWDGARWYPEATHLAFDLARRSCRADAQAFGNGKAPAQVYKRKDHRRRRAHGEGRSTASDSHRGMGRG